MPVLPQESHTSGLFIFFICIPIGNRDILLSTVVVVLVGFISIVANIFLRGMIFGGRRNNNNNSGGGIMMIIGIIFIILAPIFAMLLQLAISRKREFLADASGALITRYPEGLASALKKISEQSSKMKYANTATAHLFIINPFAVSGQKSNGRRVKARDRFSNLFSTHPKIEDRIRALIGK